jgi:hypothetical protein
MQDRAGRIRHIRISLPTVGDVWKPHYCCLSVPITPINRIIRSLGNAEYLPGTSIKKLPSWRIGANFGERLQRHFLHSFAGFFILCEYGERIGGCNRRSAPWIL